MNGCVCVCLCVSRADELRECRRPLGTPARVLRGTAPVRTAPGRQPVGHRRGARRRHLRQRRQRRRSRALGLLRALLGGGAWCVLALRCVWGCGHRRGVVDGRERRGERAQAPLELGVLLRETVARLLGLALGLALLRELLLVVRADALGLGARLLQLLLQRAQVGRLCARWVRSALGAQKGEKRGVGRWGWANRRGQIGARRLNLAAQLLCLLRGRLPVRLCTEKVVSVKCEREEKWANCEVCGCQGAVRSARGAAETGAMSSSVPRMASMAWRSSCRLVCGHSFVVPRKKNAEREKKKGCQEEGEKSGIQENTGGVDVWSIFTTARMHQVADEE